MVRQQGKRVSAADGRCMKATGDAGSPAGPQRSSSRFSTPIGIRQIAASCEENRADTGGLSMERRRAAYGLKITIAVVTSWRPRAEHAGERHHAFAGAARPCPSTSSARRAPCLPRGPALPVELGRQCRRMNCQPPAVACMSSFCAVAPWAITVALNGKNAAMENRAESAARRRNVNGTQPWTSSGQ
jgi:hypothetical protein